MTAKFSSCMIKVRFWTSETILYRTITEVDNDKLKSRGVSYVQISFVSLESPKKTAENYALVA